jgi:chemotaxis protein MotC
VTPAIAGHVALIQASLSGTDDLPKVVALLDLARLMSPGTLVEEAALRREIGLVAQMDNFDKFLALSRQYLDRFRNSIYADNFVEVLAGAAVQLAVAPDPARFARLDPLISQLRPEVQCRLLLQIARTATLKAATRVARGASERAEALAQPGTADQARARLYGAAALVATDDYERGVEKLRSVEQAALPAKDAELRDAVSAVAKRLRNWPDAATAGAAAGASPGALAVRAPSAPPLPAAATIDSAERAVATAEALLRGAPQ